MWDLMFFINTILLGVGLAMDAFSVSIADALNEPNMKKPKMLGISGTFGIFQFLMPMIGWICVHTIVETFKSFEKFIPWIALALLIYIGGGMLKEGIENKHKEPEEIEHKDLTFSALMLQALATSIDALSVGFTIAEYGLVQALVGTILIGLVTTVICMGGLLIGKKAGEKLTAHASILGGIILIGIGLEIFISSFIG